MNDLVAAYAAAVYRFELHGASTAFVFNRGGRRFDASLIMGDGPWAIITACNPRSRVMSDAENQERTGLLRRDLTAVGLAHGPSEASDRWGRFREPGFVVLGISREAALGLARAFDQRAIVFGRSKSVGLLDTWTERWIVLPSRLWTEAQ